MPTLDQPLPKTLPTLPGSPRGLPPSPYKNDMHVVLKQPTATMPEGGFAPRHLLERPTGRSRALDASRQQSAPLLSNPPTTPYSLPTTAGARSPGFKEWA